MFKQLCKRMRKQDCRYNHNKLVRKKKKMNNMLDKINIEMFRGICKN